MTPAFWSVLVFAGAAVISRCSIFAGQQREHAVS